VTDPRRPSNTALVTAACFTGGNLAVAFGGGILGLLLLTFSTGLSLLAFAATGLLFVGRVVSTSQNPAFIAQVAKEELSLPQAPSAKVLESLGGVGLLGAQLEGFNRVKQLKSELSGQIQSLPECSAKQAFLEVLPRLDDVITEVHGQASSIQRVEKELASGVIERLESEVSTLERQVREGGVRDAQIEQSLAGKKGALDNYRQAIAGLDRAKKRVDSIIAALDNAKARVTALEGRLIDPAGITEAQRAVEIVSQEVEYMSQAVEETHRLKLLN